MTAPYYACRWSSRLVRDHSTPPQGPGRNKRETRGIGLQVRALKQMRKLLAAMADSDRSQVSVERMKDLNEAFNEIQYTILALPESGFRTTALLFNDLVFFTAPAAMCTRKKISNNLQLQRPACRASGPLKLWMASIGALASEQLGETHEFFINLVAQQASILSITKLEDLQTSLSEVLWCSDIPALEVDKLWELVRPLLDPATARLFALFRDSENGDDQP